MFPAAITITHASLDTCALPFARGLRTAHRATEASCTALTDNLHQHPLPPLAPKNASIPAPTELSTRFPTAQKRFAAIAQGARWLGAFHRATQPHRACMLSQCQQGANFAFNAVPSQAHGAMLPMSFVTACQLRLRLPLSLLQGITTCVCGAAVDCYGDHCLSCRHLQTHRTPWHNLVEHAAAGMARHARYHVSHDSRRPRATSAVYSPHYCPDFSLLHGSSGGTHVLVDVTCPSVVTRTIVPASSHTPSAAATAAAASKLGVYGDVQPHVVLPFVVEHAGALGKEAMGFFKECRKKVSNELSDRDAARSTWSSWGFSNFYLQSFSVANLKGQGHFFASAAAILRARGGVRLIG